MGYVLSGKSWLQSELKLIVNVVAPKKEAFPELLQLKLSNSWTKISTSIRIFSQSFSLPSALGYVYFPGRLKSKREKHSLLDKWQDRKQFSESRRGMSRELGQNFENLHY